MPTTTTTTPFDLFSDLSSEEQQALEERRHQLKDETDKQLASLPSDPSQRTISQNRLLFAHVRRERFASPGVHPQLLSHSECQQVLDTCRKQSEWTTDRHSAFATTDIPIRPHPELCSLEPLIKERLFDELAAHYGFDASQLAFRDLFLVKYSVAAQRGLKLHTDGCLFSLTLLISHQDDFEGGGTYFASVDRVVHLKQGDVAYHDARVMHSGIDITAGERYILVGFIDTVDTISKDKRANKRTLRL